MRRGWLLGMALLGACARDEAPLAEPARGPTPQAVAEPARDSGRQTVVPAPSLPRQAPATLAGAWRVAAIDGADFNEPYGLALTADTRAIWWEPRCAGAVRGYQIEGNRIAFGPDPDLAPRTPGDPTRAVCAIAPPPRLAEVMRALDFADRIERTAANGVSISGERHSLLLFSQ